jgi:hypothetical protein
LEWVCENGFEPLIALVFGDQEKNLNYRNCRRDFRTGRLTWVTVLNGVQSAGRWA